jgi:hypothetical protein
MDNREPLLRSDWTTYRGGAVFFAGAEDCALEECFVDQVGGNAVFASGYNRRLAVRACRIWRAGGNGVAFVGDPRAVRSPLFEYSERQPLDRIDRTPGPQSSGLPGRLPGRGLPDPRDRPGGEADRAGPDRHGRADHRAPLLDLRRPPAPASTSVTAAGAGT